MHRGKLLSLLSQYAMPVQVAVQAEIAENVESVIDVLERPARLVAAVAAFGKIFDQNLAGAPPRPVLTTIYGELLQWMKSVRIKNRRDDFLLCISRS